MKRRTFGSADIKLSALGLGCMSMSHAYGDKSERNDEESLKTLQYALDHGINFFDTADMYGFGDNERLLGRFIANNQREDIFLATKFGFRKKSNFNEDEHLSSQIELCGKKAYVKEAVEASLKRLQTDYIDLLYLHRIDRTVPLEETITAMAELVKEGKVRYLGLSECTVEDLEIANQIWPISAVQSEYSFLTRNVEENGILDYCQTHGITLVAYAPLARGLMAKNEDVKHLKEGDFRKGLPRYQEDHIDNNWRLAEAFSEVAKKKGVTPAQLALSWVLNQSDIIIPIPGTKHMSYLQDNIKAVDVNLTKQELKDLDQLLIRFPHIGDRYGVNENKHVNNKKK